MQNDQQDSDVSKDSSTPSNEGEFCLTEHETEMF